MLQDTWYKIHGTGYKLQVTSCKLQVASCRLQVTWWGVQGVVKIKMFDKNIKKLK
jgi:hypothetical protein